ncbi:hypothetical protein GEMRC1_004743 [Eukaryota sp. GEM-RC1]
MLLCVIIVILCVSLSYSHNQPAYSSIEYIHPSSVSQRNLCSSFRIKLTNVQLLYNPKLHKYSIIYHTPSSSSPVNTTLLDQASTGCCSRRGIPISPITVTYNSTPFPVEKTSFTEPLYLFNVVHYKNIFHIIFDTLIPLQDSMNQDGVSQANILFHYCDPKKLVPAKYDVLFNLFGKVLHSPHHVYVRSLIVNIDREHLRCKGNLLNSKIRNRCSSRFQSIKTKFLQSFHPNPSQSDPNHLLITVLDRYPHNRQIVNLKNSSWVQTVAEKLKSYNATLSISKTNTQTISEQIRVAASTDILVGVHGAGLVHSLWLEPDSGVVCLYPPKCFNWVYNYVADTLGLINHGYNISVVNTIRNDRFPFLSKVEALDLRMHSCFEHWKDLSFTFTEDEFIDYLLPTIDAVRQNK